MIEKQNAEMVELERRILAGVTDRQPRDHIRKIFAALRVAAPSPHPRGEETCECGFSTDACATNPCHRKKVHLAGMTPGSQWPKGAPVVAAPPPAVTTQEEPVAWRWKPRGADGYFLELEKPAHGSAEPLFLSAPPPAGEERELTSEQISIINDMTHAWVEERNLVEFRMSFRQDCKRLLATVALPPAGADAVREALRNCIDILDEAQSGFIPGCGSDKAWKKGRDERVAEARALLPAPQPQEKPE